jgi:Carboxypeptidase regulatory-like domain
MAQRTTSSKADGSYLFNQLPPATYEITISAPGFQTYVQRGIVISAGFIATINAALKVGEIKQVVEVSGPPSSGRRQE